MACKCRDIASKKGYNYFALGSYEVCYGAKLTAQQEISLDDQSKVSSECLMGRYFEECRQSHVKECVGEMESLFVYKLKSAQPTKPARKNSFECFAIP